MQFSMILYSIINQSINQSIKIFINVSKYLAHRLIGDTTKKYRKLFIELSRKLYTINYNYHLLGATKGNIHSQQPTADRTPDYPRRPTAQSPARDPESDATSSFKFRTPAKERAIDPRNHPSARPQDPPKVDSSLLHIKIICTINLQSTV